jgi:tetratricopeptide (TPR) repeat protein
MPLFWVIFIIFGAEQPSMGAEVPDFGDDPFSVTGETLFQIANQIGAQPTTDAHYLLLDQRIEVFSDGRKKTVKRFIYQILTPAGLDSWSQSEWSWSPWYQKKPQLTIKVYQEDGSTSELEPDTIQESTVRNESDLIYSDRRVLRAPISGVKVGSIVEEVCVREDSKPFFPGGTSFNVYMQSSVPVHFSRVSIVQPKELNSRCEGILLDSITPKTVVNGQKKKTIYELKDAPPWDTQESNLPLDMEYWPHIAYSSVPNWHTVAHYYNGLLDPLIRTKPLPEIVTSANIHNARDASVEILKVINQSVRYTGLEFGENSIIPHHPAVVMERKYGDCKDKALLLASALNQMGFHASLALLYSGYDKDLNPDFPGLNKFNHVIVYVPGNKPLWIDPTSDTSPVGTLPASDEGRWALIASEKTNELVKIRYSTTAQNLVVEERICRMKDDGKMDVDEKTTYGGIPGSEMREFYCKSNKKDLDDQLKNYAKNYYNTDDVTSYHFGPCSPLEGDFILNIEFRDLKFSNPGEQSFSFPLDSSNIFTMIPGVLLKNNEEKKREHPFRAMNTVSYRLNYKVIPPKGYALSQIPDPIEESWHGCSVKADFEELDDKSVKANFELDFSEINFSAEQYEELKNGLLKLRNKEGVTLKFQHMGQMLFKRGKYKESLAIYRSGLEEHPDDIRYTRQYAEAFLDMGLQNKAKRVLEAYIQKHPESPDVHFLLGWVLQHDELGQLRRPGYDRAGAIRAYLKGIELKPDSWEARTNLAILYEYDALGIRYSSNANMDKALEQYNFVQDELHVELNEINLLMNQLYLKKFDEMMATAQKSDDPKEKVAFTLISIAVQHGFEKAIERSWQYPEEARNKGIESAGEYLLRSGYFTLASQFIAESAKNSGNQLQVQSRADLISGIADKLTALDHLEPAAKHAHHFYKEIFLTRDLEFKSIAPFSSKYFFSRLTDPEATYNIEGTFLMLFNIADQLNFPLESYFDLTLGIADFKVDHAEPGGFKVQLVINTNKNQDIESFYLLEKDNHLTIIGNDSILSEVGEHILELLDRGDEDHASQWLKWVTNTPIRYWERYTPIRAFFSIMDTKPAHYRRLAAATLMLDRKKYQKKAFKILKFAETLKPEKENIEIIQSYLYCLKNQRKYKRCEAVASSLIQTKEYSPIGQNFLLAAYHYQGKYDKEIQLCDSILKDPDLNPYKKEYIQLSRANAFSSQGNYENAQKILQELIAGNTTEPEVYNAYAWIRLFQLPELPLEPRDFQYGRKAASQSKPIGASLSMHTLGCLYAENGQCKEAMEMMRQSIIKRGRFTLQSSDYYIIGRVLEQYGFQADAVSWYKKIEKPNHSSMESVYHLAQKRLKFIEPGQ